jgi:phage shock protein A
MQRLWNLITGWFNQYIYQLEAESPEIAYDNAINQVVTSYKLLKQKAAAVVRRAEELKTETTETQNNLNKVNELLDSAAHLSEDQVDFEAAGEMVKTQEQLKEKLTGLLEDLAVAQTDVKEVTSALLEVESEKKKLMAEKDANIGRFRSAQARLAVMERQDGTSIDAINQSLAGVRSNIKNTIAEANLTKQLQANTLENKVKAFTQATEGQSAKQKFLQMREAARQQSAGSEVLKEVLETKQLSASATDTKTA